ncbi:hypothetical protein Tco_1026587 [Tanacetum coccineum]
MVSFDYRLNPLYAIKECSSCGALYTSDYCCSKGGLEDKILVPKTHDSSQRPPQDCVKCGNPVEGPNCQGCALWRKKLKEVWFTICHVHECPTCGDPVKGLYCQQCALIRKKLEEVFQDFQDTPESSNHNTNVVSVPQEPFVFNQDPVERCSYGQSLPPESIRLSLSVTMQQSKPLMSSHRIVPSVSPDHAIPNENSFTNDSNFVDDSPSPPP